MSEATLCSGCKKVIQDDDLGDPLCIFSRKKWWHRPCHLATTKEFKLMEQLLHQQDDWKSDTETAMADLIGNLGHFATIHGIDFEEAIRRGLGYWRDETVHPADTEGA